MKYLIILLFLTFASAGVLRSTNGNIVRSSNGSPIRTIDLNVPREPMKIRNPPPMPTVRNIPTTRPPPPIPHNHPAMQYHPPKEPIHGPNTVKDIIDCAKTGAKVGGAVGAVVGAKGIGQAIGAGVGGVMCPNPAN